MERHVQIHIVAFNKDGRIEEGIQTSADTLEMLMYAIEGVTHRRDMSHAEKAIAIRNMTAFALRIMEARWHTEIPF